MKYLLLLILISSMILSCKHAPLDPVIIDNGGIIDTTAVTPFSCDSDSIYFNEEVLPIFINSCAVSNCHDQTTAAEDFVFDSYANILASGEIEPYDLEDGDIYEVITENPGASDFMPPADSDIDPLTQDQIDAIAMWINQGLPNNSCPDLVCDTLEVTFSGDIAPMINSYCSGCHTGSQVSGDIQLANYDQIKFYANTGAIVGVISDGDAYPVMPPNTNGLSDCQVRMVQLWIADGTPNN